MTELLPGDVDSFVDVVCEKREKPIIRTGLIDFVARVSGRLVRK